MEALLFFQSNDLKTDGAEMVVVYTMGLKKWIYIPGKDIAVSFEAQTHCCRNDWLLQLGTVSLSTPPISPFCIKERYTNVSFLQLDNGFTLRHPNLGQLLFSLHPFSHLLELLPQEVAEELLLLQRQAEKHQQVMLSEDQLQWEHQFQQSQAQPVQQSQQSQQRQQKQSQPQPSSQQSQQNQSQHSQQRQRQPLHPPMTPPLLRGQLQHPSVILPPQLPSQQPPPYSAHLKPSPSTSGLSVPPPSKTEIKQLHILPSASQVKSLLARPKRQYPALRGQPSLGGQGVPSSGPLAPGTSGQPV